MSPVRLVLGVLLASSLQGQVFRLVVTTPAGISAASSGGSVTVNGTIGKTSAVDITVTYIGINSATITSAQLSGAPQFTMAGGALPAPLLPNQSVTLHAGFLPTGGDRALSQLTVPIVESIGGNLVPGQLSLILEGTASDLVVTYSLPADGNVTLAPNGGTVVFPSAQIGVGSTLGFAVMNRGSGPGVLSDVKVTGADFHLLGLQLLPVTIPSGGSVPFSIRFGPASTLGLSQGSLQVARDDQITAILLQGTSLSDLNLPPYVFTGASGPQQPKTQIAVGLSLTASSPEPINGVLTMSFDSASSGVDAALQFSTGGRTVRFTIPANSLAAVFENNSTQIRIQMGTVAGTVVLTPAFTGADGTSRTPAQPLLQTLVIPKAVPQFVDVQANAVGQSGLTIVATGFSTPRNLTRLNLEFVPDPSVQLSSSTISLNVTSAATTWYTAGQSLEFGSLFVARIPITIQNSQADSTAVFGKLIRSVRITAVNDQGSSVAAEASIQ